MTKLEVSLQLTKKQRDNDLKNLLLSRRCLKNVMKEKAKINPIHIQKKETHRKIITNVSISPLKKYIYAR